MGCGFLITPIINSNGDYLLQDELKRLFEEEHKKLDEKKATEGKDISKTDDSTPPKKDGTD